MKPGCATIRLGAETHTSQDEITFRARRLVALKAMNETQYRYTTLPGALRTFSTNRDKQNEMSVQAQCNKDAKVQPLTKVKVEPSGIEKVEPTWKLERQASMKKHKQKPMQASSKNTQPKVPSESTKPRKPSPNDKEEVQMQPLDLETIINNGSAQALLEESAQRNSMVSRNVQECSRNVNFMDKVDDQVHVLFFTFTTLKT